MYSVLMMAALTAGSSAPDFGFGGGGCGCYITCGCGCYGGGGGGCYGGGGGGYNGGGGCGGYGGGGGGYNGGGGYGCYGGGGGGYNGGGGCGCYGGGGGGFNGGGGYGCGGAAQQQMPYAAPVVQPIIVVCVPVPMPPAPTAVAVAPARRPAAPACDCGTTPPGPGAAPGQRPETVPPPRRLDANGQETGAKAKVIVELPRDAKLFIDEQLMKSNSDKRAFITPPLANGQEYFYDVRAEVVRNGDLSSRPSGST